MMRKYILTFLILLFAIPSFAEVSKKGGQTISDLSEMGGQTISGLSKCGGQTIASAGCVSPACPATCFFATTEGFEGGSSDCWSSGTAECKNTWTSSGSTIALDTSPAGANEGTDCSQSLKFTIVENTDVYTQFNYGSSIDTDAYDVDVYIRIYFDTITLPDNQNYNIFNITTGPGPITLKDTGSDTHVIYETGDTISASISVSEDTWYTIHVHYDGNEAAGELSYISLDGDDDCAEDGGETATCKVFRRNDQDVQYVQYGAKNVGAGESGVIYIAYTYISITAI